MVKVVVEELKWPLWICKIENEVEKRWCKQISNHLSSNSQAKYLL